ncbi:MAG: hypothetical protein ACLTBU_00275 [Zhenhengia sp.]|uniref:Uncharacterized protein n=1 Tax=Zhenhengia yiwuensis TaxID=2763666 RepID=A0A926EK27_9FIRM|nr:hypothetical protein [Zhenhengia yiwuensis]MBC8581161.1 hypothetical protein [Zhenhengia yiwuensis]MBS5800343.1 hypothetical protein [Clostridiales bacterium]
MKKNIGYMVIIISIIIIFMISNNYGNKPFEHLVADEIGDILLNTDFSDVSVRIEESEHIKVLSRLLKRIIIQEEERPNKYEVSMIHFTLNMKDGNKIQLSLCNPYLLIDGKSYKMKYGAGEQLRMLWYQYIQKSLVETYN